MKRTVDLIAELRRAATVGGYGWDLMLEASDRLDNIAWDGLPPRTPHLAADSSPDAGDVDAGASPPTRRVDRPASGGDGGGGVRLASTAMPLAATEFSDGDPCNPHGVVRHRGLYVVTP